MLILFRSMTLKKLRKIIVNKKKELELDANILVSVFIGLEDIFSIGTGIKLQELKQRFSNLTADTTDYHIKVADRANKIIESGMLKYKGIKIEFSPKDITKFGK